MLVLSRKKGEKIRLGPKGEIVVQIVEVRGNLIKLGITAPKDVPVHREEVFQLIQKD